MPLAPTPVMAVPSKPKIGFSIDSIVGGERKAASPGLGSPGSAGSPRSPSPRPLLRPSALPPAFPPDLKRLPYLDAPSHHHQFLAHFQGAALAAALHQQGFPRPRTTPRRPRASPTSSTRGSSTGTDGYSRTGFQEVSEEIHLD
ncbi:unnamed protein product [Plutella xylostella]|uniref:(diamondback moth) hypothetical protein n=1 Tax=Plutella xylostella TaxID=51655 RepID=A0A8S4ERZ1_PLUXY|nr:unnamed protein product [Plutella xylostella]